MYYGITTRKEIELFTGEVVAYFDGERIINDHINKKYHTIYMFMMRVFAVETQVGTYSDKDDNNGFGLSQIDKIKFKDIIENGQEHRDKVWNKWKVDINLLTPESLRYDWKSAIIMTRLGLKRIPEAIPSTLKAQAKYWKKHWNTYNGKGTQEDFIKSAQVNDLM